MSVNENLRPLTINVRWRRQVEKKIRRLVDEAVAEIVRAMGSDPSKRQVHVLPSLWKRDDAAWFTAHPRRSHRVRDGFPGEFERASGGPVDFVVVRQIQPGLRIRAPFTLVECGADALGMMQALAMRGLNDDEAAAHTLFDLTRAGGRLIPTVELAELIARYAIAPGSGMNSSRRGIQCALTEGDHDAANSFLTSARRDVHTAVRQPDRHDHDRISCRPRTR